MFFFVTFALALALEIGLASHASRARFAAFFRPFVPVIPRRFAGVILGALVVSFALELAIVARGDDLIRHRVAWITLLPIAVMRDDLAGALPAFYRFGLVGVRLIETALLAAFLLSMRGARWGPVDTIVTALAACVTIGLALASAAMSSGDLYAYVAYGLLGPAAAYAPPAAPLPGEYGIIPNLYGSPVLPPAAYGPLWLYFNSAVVGLGGSLFWKLICLRFVNVAALAVILVALRVLKVDPPLVAATAVNPAIAFYYITNGHNDLLVIAVILVAMTFAARSPVTAGILAGLAASIKLTMVIPAAAAALAIRTRAQRLVYCAAVLATAGLVVVVLGGASYFHALTGVSQAYSSVAEPRYLLVPHLIIALATVGFTCLAVFASRTYKTASFGFASLAMRFYPWYAIWGLPYAAARRDLLTTLLVGLPIVTAILDVDMGSRYIGVITVLGLIAANIALLGKAGAASLERAKVQARTGS